MRIGQLARRLALSPTDIVGFLAAKGIETETGTNTRLDDSMVTAIVNHFAPGRLSEILQSETAEVPQEVITEVQENIVEVVEQALPINPEPVLETADEVRAEETSDEPTEVIRVAKVELQGLKVLGKIELPQPKKKEAPVEGAEQPEQAEQTEQPEKSEQPSTQRPPRRELQKRNDRREQRTWSNPIEQQRKREAEENERKRKEQFEAKKEKRTNHYYSKVKSVPTKPVRRYEENTVEEDVEVKEPPKTIIGKFFRWLRS